MSRPAFASFLIPVFSLAAAAAFSAELQWGGLGGAYFLAPPGELWVEVEKTDLHTADTDTFLRAILLGPDRSVLADQLIPGDGQDKRSTPGHPQSVRLSTVVPRKGIYALNVTVSNDRYGEKTAWSLKTNCPHYLIETSRSHRDEPHQEPIVLLAPQTEGDVCFLPRAGRFNIDISDLVSGSTAVVYDPDQNIAAQLAASSEGTASASLEFPFAAPEKPWRLHLSHCQATINIDGVTRWKEGDTFQNLSLWTPQPHSWFPFAACRWLLTPYNCLLYGSPGDEGKATFQLHNNGTRQTTVTLHLEFPENYGAGVPPAHFASLSTHEVVLQPKAGAEVVLNYRIPADGDKWLCHLIATPDNHPEFTTWSTLELRKGDTPATAPIQLPIVITPYRHENQLFGYNPPYPLDSEFYFDTHNRPVTFPENGFDVWRDGAWLGASIDKTFTRASTKAAFDKDNWLYVVGNQQGQTAFAWSSDNGKSFDVTLTDGKGACDIEQFSGHNTPQGPPPFLRYTETKRDPKRIWRRFNDLNLFLPEKTPDGKITIPPPVLITRDCIGYSGHSGMPSTVVSRGDKTHVIWAEATEPDANAPGVPTFVATYDRAARVLAEPVLIGHGPPANDIHNTPCITIDSQGYLHALIGTHGRTFQYARSIEPNAAAAGFTPPEEIAPGLRQTYIGMVCGTDDTLHVAFRLWKDDKNYFPADIYAVLAYMSKKPGQPWSQPQTLVVPPFSSYSIFRHRLTIDRKGQLFLSYDTWSTFWFYRTDHPGNRRALLTSPDNGATWKLAEAL